MLRSLSKSLCRKLSNQKIILVATLITISFNISYSQVNQDSIAYSVKGEYKELFPNRITAKIFYTNTFNSYVFGDRNSNLRLEAVPNKQDRIGASVSYDLLTLSYSFAPDFLAENKDNQDSKLFNLNLRLFFGQWMQTLDIYSEKGFYESSSGVYFPDTKAFKIGGSTSYIFNENFSYRAISNQDEKQLKSAGSFIAGMSYFYSKFNLISGVDEERIDEDLKSFDIALTPGYQYNFVPFDNLLLSFGGKVGIGLNHSESDFESLTSLLTTWDISATATYDIENFYVGTHYQYLVLNHNTDRSTYTSDNIPFFQAFIGYRFRAPKTWVRKTEELKNKMKL